MRGRESDSVDVRLSKTLSYILRHGALKENLKIRSDGFIKVNDLLDRPKLKGFSIDDIRRIVADNDKRRFALLEEIQDDGSSLLLIRANQGHSLKVQKLELEPIKSQADLPVVVHGTFSRFWPKILEEGLKPMTRTHIHFAPGLVGEDGVISGMRKQCDIFIYIDVEKCFKDEISFFRSANGVILSEGLSSTKNFPSEYFIKVQNKAGLVLFPPQDSKSELAQPEANLEDATVP